MAADLGTIVIGALSAVVSTATTIVVMTWKVASKVQAFEAALKNMERRAEAHDESDKEFHHEVDEYMAEDRRAWLELNRTLGKFEGRAERDWSETTGSTIMRPREKSRPDR